MDNSSASSVQAYLEQLPTDRRGVVAALRQLVLLNLPQGYQEALNWGMISYEIPLDRYPITYNKQPLLYAALAAQKNQYSLYLMCVYQDLEQEGWLREEFARAGKKLDMGKSRLRFRKLEDLPLDVIARVIASTPPEAFIARYEAVRRQ